MLKRPNQSGTDRAAALSLSVHFKQTVLYRFFEESLPIVRQPLVAGALVIFLVSLGAVSVKIANTLNRSNPSMTTTDNHHSSFVPKPPLGEGSRSDYAEQTQSSFNTSSTNSNPASNSSHSSSTSSSGGAGSNTGASLGSNGGSSSGGSSSGGGSSGGGNSGGSNGGSSSGFFPASFWDQPDAQTGTVAANSSTLVNNLITQYQTYYGTFGLSSGNNGIPYFTVPANQPLVTINVSGGCGNFTANTGTQVPIPSNAYTSSGSDHIIDIYQPSTETEWEFWSASYSGGKWSACWGGKIVNMSTVSDAVFTAPYGESATGLPYLASIVTEADVENEAINHALEISVNDTASSPCYVSPADRCDGTSTKADAIPEGTWYRLNPSLNVANYPNLTPFAKLVFVALQKYGMFVIDTSGGVEMSTEASADWAYQGNSGTDPITSSFAPDNQGTAYAVLDGMPWSQLQVLSPPPL